MQIISIINKSLKQIYYLSVVVFLNTSHALACYPNYDNNYFFENTPVGLPPLVLEKEQNKTADALIHQHPFYDFEIKNTTIPNWQLLIQDPSFTEISAIYPLKNGKINGYVLMEHAGFSDPCESENEIKANINQQVQVQHFQLPQLPAGFEIKIFEKRQGKHIFQTAIFVRPQSVYFAFQGLDIPSELQFAKSSLVLRAKYHKDLESTIKPFIESYFQVNRADWIDSL